MIENYYYLVIFWKPVINHYRLFLPHRSWHEPSLQTFCAPGLLVSAGAFGDRSVGLLRLLACLGFLAPVPLRASDAGVTVYVLINT